MVVVVLLDPFRRMGT